MEPALVKAEIDEAIVLSVEDRRDALKRVLNSSEFSGSPKLCEFLDYVVQEQLAGRSKTIKGKTIAVDVYGRDLGEGAASHNTVRVEARRLRRLLEDYYEGDGKDDPVRIYMDPGGYVPRFETAEKSDERPDGPLVGEMEPPIVSGRWSRRSVWIGSGTLLGIAMASAGWMARHPSPPAPEAMSTPPPAVRAALREHSVPVLQAVDVAAEARALYFPVFDARRQRIALDMYQYAIELAPDLSDGYAGSAQVLATLHMIEPDIEQRTAYLADAVSYAEKALARGPSNAWAVASDAWGLAQSGRAEEALSRARTALELAPNDGHILDLIGVTAIYANDPALAAMVSDPERDRQGVKRTGTQNIWGLSNLMLGENERTIAAFGGAATDGTVVSAPSLMFQAVAHKRNGDETDAAALVAELKRTWPEFPAEFLIRRVFATTPKTRDEMLNSYLTIGSN